MKISRKLLCFLLAIVLGCCTGIIGNCQKAEAAIKVWAPSNVRCGVGMRYAASARIDLVSPKDTIKNIKAYQGKKRTSNLIVKQTYRYHSEYTSSPYATLTFYAKKTGTYKIKFDVYKTAKSKRTSREITVHAKGYGGVISSVSLNGKYIIKDSKDCSSYYYHGSSAKVKFGLAKGYKIKKIRIVRYDQNGDPKRVAFKNGKKVTFGKYGSSLDTESTWQRAMWSLTQFEITYRDSFAQDVDNNEYTTYYYLYTKASKWY